MFTSLPPLDSNLIGTSEADVVHVFPVPSTLNCSGMVSEVGYCYRPSRITANTVLTLLILDQSGSTFNITKAIAIRRDTSSEICEFSNICCDAIVLDSDDLFSLPASNFAFGIITESLLAPRSSSDLFQVEHYRFPSHLVMGTPSQLMGTVLSGGTRDTDRALRLLEFAIGKEF